MQTLVRVDADRLVLRVNRSVRCVAASLVLVGILIVAGVGTLRTRDPRLDFTDSTWRFIVGGLILLCGAGTALFPNGAAFDRRRGRLSLRRFVSIRHYPLEQIRAVELLDGGWHHSRRSRSYRTTELTLVLDNSFAPRLYLTNHADDRLTLSMGGEIAQFLDVTLRDMTVR